MSEEEGSPPGRAPPGARLSLFLGKGGVGRTTLACAFAVDRALAGDRVLLVSLTSAEDAPDRIQHEAAGVDTAGHLTLLHLDARHLVDDIVRALTRLGSLSEYILRNPSYESLVDIAPGIREMAILHELAKLREEGRHDRIVLDAPATGHGIHFLEAPDKTARILAGPLKTRAEALATMLKDPAATDVVLVTLAEEMPVREAADLARTLRAQGFEVDNVVVNKWLPRAFEDEPSRRALDALPASDPWARAMRLVAAQREEADAHLAELRALDAKLAIVPLIPDSGQRLVHVARAMKDFVPGGRA